LFVLVGDINDGVLEDDTRKELSKTTFTCPLHDGDMIIMTDDTQKFTKHGVPKRTRCKEPRINLTFRQMKK
jgi:hypothetical protein